VSQFEPVVTPKERCDECGFVYAEVSPADAVEKLRSFGRRYKAPLTRFLAGEDGDSLLRERPEDGVWSPLEYAAHVRDVFAWYDERVRRSLSEDRPPDDGPGPDEAADAGHYNDLDPGGQTAGLGFTNNLYIYDIATNIWSTGTPMPDVRAFMASACDLVILPSASI